MTELQEKFLEIFPEGKVNEPLLRHSWYKIGGPAELFFSIQSSQKESVKVEEILTKLIKFTQENKIPFYIIGGGSNILASEEGFKGLIIKFQNNNISHTEDILEADAGVQISQLVKYTIDHNLSGLEHWATLPGSVGGAIYGNAGCHGLETKDIIKSAKVFNPETLEVEVYSAEDLMLSYRNSIFKIEPKGKIILSGKFKIHKGKISKEEQEELKEKLSNSRNKTQPKGFSSGCIFKNPLPDKPAGMLIDQAGLKGKVIGKAQISDIHANFFLNKGGATYKDIKSLIELAQKEVKDKFNIELETEVQIIPSPE